MTPASSTATPMADLSPIAAAAAEYGEVRRRTRELIRETIPAEATVAIVSKGDDDLVRLDGRQGWHFPRTETGQYAGHHPQDANAAIAHLEETRRAGAHYFVVPKTYLWWLDHYRGLAEHLESRYAAVARDLDACLIFSLAGGETGGAIEQAGDAAAHEEPLARQLRDFLRSLLPEGAGFVLALGPDEEWLEAGQSATWRVPARSWDHADGGVDAVVGRLEDGARGGAAYLVIPRPREARKVGHEALAEALKRKHRLIAEQEHLCLVFALRGITTGESSWRA
jgi:hypothetical protein